MAPLDDSLGYHTYDDVTVLPCMFPREVLNPTLAAALDYWQAAGAHGGIARRCDLEPARMVRFLRSVLLWDYDPAAGTFVCRLAGTHVCEAAGRELRGQTLEGMHGPGSDAVRRNFEAVVEFGYANFVRRRMSWVNRCYRHYERLLLPLGDQDGQPRHLMGIMTVDFE